MADRLDWVCGSGTAAVAQPWLVQRKISLYVACDAVSRSPIAQQRLAESHPAPDSWLLYPGAGTGGPRRCHVPARAEAPASPVAGRASVSAEAPAIPAAGAAAA